jgi:hypothetical protein
VTVVVQDLGLPVPERWVVFHDHDGNVLARARSDHDGKARAAIPAGGMVTIARDDGVQHLTTFLDVQPGDALVVDESSEEEGTPRVVGAARIKLPGRYPGARIHVVSMGVGKTIVDPALSSTPPVLERFLVEGRRFRVLAEAVGDANEPLAYAFAWVEWDAEKTAVHATVDVELDAWRTDWRTFTLVPGPLPEEATEVRGRLAVLGREEDRFESPPRQRAVADGGVGALTFPVPPPLGAAVEYRIEASLGAGAARRRRVLVGRTDALPEASTLDLRAGAQIASAAVDRASPPARPALRWAVTGDGARADALLLRATWGRRHEWTVAMPFGTHSPVRLPELPPELADWAPGAEPVTVAAAVIDASFYDGYADVRRKGIRLVRHPPVAERSATLLRASVTGDLPF